FDVGDEPDRERVVAGPFERLALGDEGIVVALRPADGFRRRLRPRREARARERKPDRAGGAEAAGKKLPTAVIDFTHGNVLPPRLSGSGPAISASHRARRSGAWPRSAGDQSSCALKRPRPRMTNGASSAMSAMASNVAEIGLCTSTSGSPR